MIGLLLALGAAAAGQDGGLASLESLPDDVPPAAIAAHPAIRRLVAAHRESLPALVEALGSARSWKIRLGAAFALKETGFKDRLRAAVDDADARVREFARAITRHPPVSSDQDLPAYYPRDASLKGWSDALARTAVELDPSERGARMAAVAADLVAPLAVVPEEGELRSAAEEVAGRDRSLAIEALLDRFRGGADRTATLDAVARLSWTADGPLPPVPGLEDAINSGLSSGDSRQRRAAVSATRGLPEEERSRTLSRALVDADRDVRVAAGQDLLDLLRAAHDDGRPERVDALLRRFEEFVASEKTDDLRQSMEQLGAKDLGRISAERKKLAEGVTDDETGENPRRCYLKVGKRLQPVSEEVYAMALARAGKPYVTAEEFEAIRVEANSIEEPRPPLPPAGTTRVFSSADSARRNAKRNGAPSPAEPGRRPWPALAILAAVGAILAGVWLRRRGT